MPGVLYPKEVFLLEVPKGFVTCVEAAGLLACSPSAARQLLARRGVKRLLVAGSGRGCAVYCRAAVCRVARGLPQLGPAPAGLVSASCAVSLLGLARSALDRLEKRGLLHVVRRRVRGRAGVRVRCFYDAAELAALRRDVVFRLRERLHVLEGGAA